MIFSDRELSQKLERAEARASADFVESRARLYPESGAEWIEVAGACALFDGPESPTTQTFGLGMFGEITDDRLLEIEEFFTARGAPILHEVSPMAEASLMPLLNERGYQPFELTSVMYRPIGGESDHPESPVTTRIINESEIDMWARTSANGWTTEMPEFAEFMFQFGQIGAQCRNAYPFLAELDGRPIATGTLFIHQEVAMLAGASTVPEGRRQGAQNALLKARLNFAREHGCTLAAMGASPGSQSQRNAQKNGFQIAYTRIKWQKKDE